MLRAMWITRGTKAYGIFAVCLVVSMLLAVWFVPVCFAVDAVEASIVINEAERGLSSAYVVVADAEGAGADVSALLSKLDSAGDFISEAHVAFWSGDYENASVLADECSNAVKGIADDAARLKTDAEKALSDRLLLTVTESGVGLILLLVFGLLGWKLLKRHYFRRALEMKPQMEETR